MSTRLRVDHFETATDVCATIFRRGIREDEVKVSFGYEDHFLCVQILTNPQEQFNCRLVGKVVPEESFVKCTPSKIEIHMRKFNRGEHWGKLEQTIGTPSFALDDNQPKHPDWDKIGKTAMEEEEKETNDSVDGLFKKIYRDADDNTRKAMVKSYQESGGTVLSTNWEQICQGPVDVKPPDGMEYKKWEQ